jgi:glutamate N-acetyltransferase / amino-acid N-acetyltransferase
MIGKRFDTAKMEAALPGVVAGASADAAGGRAAARAIMTTDLVMKEAAFEDEVDGRMVRVGGMCKGSGMIHPNMATMLGFVTCDAAVERGIWQQMVRDAADASFNAITVDGDTSTNDVLFALCAGGDGGGKLISDIASPAARAVQALVTETCTTLARQIARDGEGATLLMEVRVTGAVDPAGARAIARAVAGSSLTKAAVHGRDPNWGRIAAAAGRAGVPLDTSSMSVRIGGVELMRAGEPVEFDAAAVSGYMKTKGEAGPEGYCSEADTVLLEVGLEDGDGEGVAWGCDLSKEYVTINADYST